MDIKSIILIIIALLDFLVGFVLIFKNPRSPIYATFALVLLGGGLWSFGIAMFRSTLDMEVALAWTRIYYFSPTIIVLAFLAFSNYYIYKLHELDITKIIYFLLPFLFITFIIFHPTFFIEKAYHYEWGNDAKEKLGGHLLFVIYFFSYLILSYKILFKKLKNSEGVNRKNIFLVIIATMSAYFMGLIFDLILPIMGNYKLIWIGPYFTVLVSMTLIYLIFYRKIRIEQ